MRRRDRELESIGHRKLVAAPFTVQQIHGRRADKPGDKCVGRLVIDLLGRIDLLKDTVFHDGNARSQRHGLDLVMA